VTALEASADTEKGNEPLRHATEDEICQSINFFYLKAAGVEQNEVQLCQLITPKAAGPQSVMVIASSSPPTQAMKGW